MDGNSQDIATLDEEQSVLDPYPGEPVVQPDPRRSAPAEWRALANPTRVRR